MMTRYKIRFPGILAVILIFCATLSCGGPNLQLDCSTLDLRVYDTTCGQADVAWEIWMVTWEDRGHDVMDLPWSRNRDLCTGDIEITAIRQCQDDGTITVEIWVDGTRRRQVHGQGPGASAHTELWID